MSLSTVIETSAALSDRQMAALVSLLADEDPAVYQTIRDTLVGYGPTAVAWLRPRLQDRDPLLQERAQEIILFLERQEADNRFLAFCLGQGEDLDLEQGAWGLAQTQYPELKVPAYQNQLDRFADELRNRLGGQTSVPTILATLNEYLFGELGFVGNEKNYYEPDNTYFNRVLDRKTGNPVSLCLLYLLVARRLQLPIVGIGMPGHFLCRYQSLVGETFIDAFNQGKLLTKAECVKHLIQSGHGSFEGYLAPISPRRMLLRMCANLHQIYVDLEQPREASRLQRYIVALSK